MANKAAKEDSRKPVKRTKRHKALRRQRLGMIVKKRCSPGWGTQKHNKHPAKKLYTPFQTGLVEDVATRTLLMTKHFPTWNIAPPENLSPKGFAKGRPCKVMVHRTFISRDLLIFAPSNLEAALASVRLPCRRLVPIQ